MSKPTKHTGLADEIRAALKKATLAGKWLSTRQLDEICQSSPGTAQLASTLHALHRQGDIVRQIIAGTTKYAYQLRMKASSAEPSAAAPEADAKPPATSTADARPADAPTSGAAAPPRSAKPFAYNLYEHVTHALRDVEDLTFAAVEGDVSRDVHKALLTAQASLRRAQEAIVRQRQGAAA